MKSRWLDEGLAVLAEQGSAGLRIDRIGARLGLTKGSFHHHFDGADDYRSALLERYEAASTEAITSAVAAVRTLPPERALMELPSHITLDPSLDAAIRGWAYENQAARAALTRVDSARLDALVSLWQQILPKRAAARSAALVPHLLMIGASVAMPRPSEKELRAVFSLLATLVPSVRS